MVDDTATPDEIRALLQISCADAGPLLSDLHDGMLPPDDRTRVEAHLGGCVACGVILDQIRTTAVVLRLAASARPHPEPAVIDQIMTRMRESPN